jgi:hypothetical protein
LNSGQTKVINFSIIGIAIAAFGESRIAIAPFQYMVFPQEIQIPSDGHLRDFECSGQIFYRDPLILL